MTSRRTALIVGAGIGWLAAGIALGRAGWHVRIFERATEVRALGFGLSLAPNAIAALRELGLAGRVMAEACSVGKVEIRTAGGKVLKRFNVAADLADVVSVFALRQALHRALIDAIPPAAMSVASDAAGFESAGSRVLLRFRDGRSEMGDVLSARTVSTRRSGGSCIRRKVRQTAVDTSRSVALPTTLPIASLV
ncbi:hypothetical protein BH18ACI5_BH18ACI5_05770 [soil metagenome]